MRSTFPPLLLILLSLPLFARAAAPDTTKPADIEHMKTIGAALNAFKKAKGEFPAQLSDLVPDWVDAKTLVSPLGVEPNPLKRGNPTLPCSYSYEYGTDILPYQKVTTREGRALQLQEFGPTVPILSCYLYKKMLHLSHAGDLYETVSNWEWDDETRRLMKKNSYGPGLQVGKKLIVTVTDEAGHPLLGIPVAVSGRICSGVMLVDRDYVSGDDGKITIPIGTEPNAAADLRCLLKDWFLLSKYWKYGDPGTDPEKQIGAITVVLTPAKPIGGIVRDSNGQPLPKTRVLMVRPSAVDPDESMEVTATMTDEQGTWSLPSLPAKDLGLKLRFQHQGAYRVVEGKPGTHGIPDFATLSSPAAEIRLPPPFLFRGVVRSPDGPVAGAQVSLFGCGTSETTTDAEGRFETTAVREGKSAFVVTADDWAPLFQEVRMTEDAAPFKLTMEAGRPLQGRLVLGANGGIPNTPVVLSGLSDVHYGASNLRIQPVIAVTDGEGRFIWKHAPKTLIWCRTLLADGEPWRFRWDAKKNDELTIRVEQKP